MHFYNENCQNKHLARGSSPTEGSGKERIAHVVGTLQSLSGSRHPVTFTAATSKSFLFPCGLTLELCFLQVVLTPQGMQGHMEGERSHPWYEREASCYSLDHS